MDNCLLCLQNHVRCAGYITLNSPQWFQFKILEKIEKHLWPIDSMQNIFGICSMCWEKLNDFHNFYKTIENAHQRNVQISKREASLNCLGTEILQLNNHQTFKAEIPAPEELSYIIDELDTIKTEVLLEDDDSRVSASMENMQNEIGFQPEKRKRGRPKKYNIYESLFSKKSKGEVGRQSNITKATTQKSPKRKRGRPRKLNTILTKNPKGKRGRPRKYVLDINVQGTGYSKIVNTDINPSKDDVVHQPIAAHEQEITQQSGVAKTVGKGSPQKVKRSRGRPRKTQINGPNFLNVVHELPMPAPEELNSKQELTIQGDEETNDIIINSNNTKKLVHKKNNFFSLMKKRKQRRALMRNYIATSVLCMKFLKKD